MKKFLQLTWFLGAAGLSLASPSASLDGELAVLDDVVKAIEHLRHGNGSRIPPFTLSSGEVELVQATTLDTSVPQGLPTSLASTLSSNDTLPTTLSSSDTSDSQSTTTSSAVNDYAATITPIATLTNDSTSVATSSDGSMLSSTAADNPSLTASSTNSSDTALDTSDSDPASTSDSATSTTNMKKRSNNRPWRRFAGFRA